MTTAWRFCELPRPLILPLCGWDKHLWSGKLLNRVQALAGLNQGSREQASPTGIVMNLRSSMQGFLLPSHLVSQSGLSSVDLRFRRGTPPLQGAFGRVGKPGSPSCLQLPCRRPNDYSSFAITLAAFQRASRDRTLPCDCGCRNRKPPCTQQGISLPQHYRHWIEFDSQSIQESVATQNKCESRNLKYKAHHDID